MPEPSGNLYGRVWGESPPEAAGALEGTDPVPGEAAPKADSGLTREQLEDVVLRIESRLVTLENQVRITNRSLALISDRLRGGKLPADGIWTDFQPDAPPRP